MVTRRLNFFRFRGKLLTHQQPDIKPLSGGCTGIPQGQCASPATALDLADLHVNDGLQLRQDAPQEPGRQGFFFALHDGMESLPCRAPFEVARYCGQRPFGRGRCRLTREVQATTKRLHAAQKPSG